MSTRVVWYGERVLAKVKDATRQACDDVTQYSARDAQGSHWWKNRTTVLQSQIANEPARVLGLRVKGKFGTTKDRGFYGLFLEKRTPFLRPAADRNFRLFGRAIALRLKWRI